MPTRIWTTPYHPARPFLLERGLYLMLALDCWLLMMQHGGRYGMGGFNVAHFAWADGLFPLTSPTLYVGLVCAAGLLSLSAALFEVSRFHKLTLTGLYTVAWLLSMHDSYQHHYFISWLLLYCVALPSVTSRDASRGRPLGVGSGLPLTAITCAVVYLFTAIAKISGDWRDGQVLRALAGSRSGPFTWFPTVLTSAGVPETTAWQLVALSVVALQLAIAAGYALCTLRDDADRRWLNIVCTLAGLGALLFHLLTELDAAFAIGWFSYYMLWIALTMFAPARWLQVLCTPIARARERIGGAILEQTPSMALALGSSCLLCWFVAQSSDLPGVPEASIAVLVTLVLEAAYRMLRREPEAALRCAIVPGVALAGLFAALGLTSVRFDYYRRAAGELSRMGQLEQALQMYRKAEQHAPSGKTRMTKIDKLQRELEAQDAGLPETGDE